MFGQAQIAAADRLIPSDGRRAIQFFIRCRSVQQMLEVLAIFLGKVECRAVVVLALRRAAGINMKSAQISLPEQHTPTSIPPQE
jgi:hypothetical protein